MSWLWRNDSSTSSFEKALSKLSAQISSGNVSLERTRSTGRRVKALWTLYTSLAYLVAAIILFLVIGPQDWNIAHYGVLAGAPLVIYGVRRVLTAVFDWRAGRQQAHLEGLQQQREEKIAQLKKATKYDSTQELLQKYGGAPPKEKQTKSPKQETKRKADDGQPAPKRTGLPPPPTANIPSNIPSPMMQQSPRTPQRSPAQSSSYQQTTISPEEPGFAPNAFSEPLSSRAVYEQTPHWYDRILDVMLGEDENLAKNRLVMLCRNCRQVNGQAPPGIKTPEELGRWRCASCGAWNGVDTEMAKVVKEVTGKSPSAASEEWQQVSHGDDELQSSEEQIIDTSPETAGGVVGTTGASDDTDTTGITKRMTRSAGKPETDGL